MFLSTLLVATQLQTATPAPPATPAAPPASAPPAAPPETSAPVVRVGPDDGVSVQSADGNFLVRGGILIQGRYELRAGDSGLTGSAFDVHMVRPQLSGHLLRPWIRFFVQPELAGPSPRLLDLQLDVQPHEAIGLRVGQFVTPFSRAFLVPVPVLQFPDLSIANNFFRADRDTGAMLFGTPCGGRLEYYAGVFNGNGIDRSGNDNHDMLWMARLVVSPLGPMPYTETPGLSPHPAQVSFGLNAYVNNVTPTQQVLDTDTGMLVTRRLPDQLVTTVGADVAIHAGPWMLQAEGYFRHTRRADGSAQQAWGGYAQTGLFVLPKLELAERVSLVAPDASVSRDLVTASETQGTWYLLGNHLKLHLRYTLLHADSPTTLAPVGFTHALTAQIQTSF
jgi:hypothetical protein